MCDELNVDIDMVNAHPCILQYICRQNNIICICLDSYVANRAQLVLLINKKQKIKNTFFLAFDAEIKTIQKRLCELNPLLVKEITKKGKDNVSGRLTNQLMCKIENEILQLADTRS